MSRLNAIELGMMQSPLRRLSQRHVELRAFLRMLRRAEIDLVGKRLLDAGCGSGYGLELLQRSFRPSRLVGFDLMPEQVVRAARRAHGATIYEADVTAIPEDDGAFDAAFVFGILHHVPAWRRALVELARVLAPGGALLVEEIRGGFIDVQDCMIGTDHPREARFEWDAFREGIAAAGLRIDGEVSLVPGAVRSFLARKV